MPGNWTPRSNQNQEAKDWGYEFGITLGAARGNIQRTGDEAEDLKALFAEFDFMLTAKSHPNFINRFNQYFRQRPKMGQAPASNPNIITITK